MAASFSSKSERDLVAVLRGLPHVPGGLVPVDLFASAEQHGLTGVLLDAWRASGHALPPDLAARLDAMSIARELDHAAHLALLRRIDARFVQAGLDGVVLKGPLFAERYYARPSTRSTSDLDLLVRAADLERAGAVLEALGWRLAEDPDEAARVQRDKHHLHYAHPEALPLELHFRAYSGFGHVLPSEPLVERRAPVPLAGFESLGVLAPEDELVFLAVHAGAHRFVRLAWLYDLKLLVELMTQSQIVEAARRAQAWGYGRLVSFAASLLVDVFGGPSQKLAPLGHVGSLRAPLVRRLVAEPRHPLLRSATRFVYTTALCDDGAAALRYAVQASGDHARRLLRKTS